jgi:hypothetical protein
MKVHTWHGTEANRSRGRDWNAVDVGPMRYLLMELAAAGRAKGLHFGIHYSIHGRCKPLWLIDKPGFVSERLSLQLKHVVTHVEPGIIFSTVECEMSSEQRQSPDLLAWLLGESRAEESIRVDCQAYFGSCLTCRNPQRRLATDRRLTPRSGCACQERNAAVPFSIWAK